MTSTSTTIEYASAKTAASLLAAREVSAVELCDAQIARIQRYDSEINALVLPDFERARQAAKAADAALRRDEHRPLLGVPITVKESFNVNGLKTSWGVPAFRGWTPSCESQAIRRLRAAGAIILGKSNVSEALTDWQCFNRVFGRTNNPWDLTRTCGGSSGGSAAALAAGFSFLEVGSDLAGSIRIPAHFCGVFGHRPTFGVLSTEGYSFPSTLTQSDLCTVGPLARTAGDLAMGFELLLGNGDPDARRDFISLPAARRNRLQEFRVLPLPTHPLIPTSTVVQAQVIRFASELEKAGATVLSRCPLLPDLAEATRACLRLLGPVTLGRVSSEHYRILAEIARALPQDDDRLSSIVLRAGTGSYRDWQMANERRAHLLRQWHAVFQEIDVLICPAAPTVAFPHDERPVDARLLDVDGTLVSYFNQIAWAALATGPGLPATTLPFGLVEDGLPCGIQVIGPHREDRTPLRFAELAEQHFGGCIFPKSFPRDPGPAQPGS